jgi:hypothetical protein
LFLFFFVFFFFVLFFLTVLLFFFLASYRISYSHGLLEWLNHIRIFLLWCRNVVF